MIPFDFQLRTRFVFGPGRLAELGNLASEMGARRALVVSDPGVVRAGHTGRALEYLARAGIETHLFQDLHENPTTDDVERGVKLARRHDPELLIGLGGGSSMDCTKGINFIYSNGGEIRDYWGVGKALHPMLPMIAVPTTAGTGSEAQSFALISDSQTHAKMACGDKKASFRIALLDPELTCTQPFRVTALTGIDAIAHAIETFVTRHRNTISLLYSRAAWQHLAGSFLTVLEQPENLAARGDMQWGACLAGLAIENSMLGIAHSLANPLTAHFQVPHGQAIAVMLPHVVRFNSLMCRQDYGELYASIPEAVRAAHDDLGDGAPLANWIQKLTRRAGLADHLQGLGVKAHSLRQLGEEASRQWTAQFNPRSATADEMVQLYEAAFPAPSDR